MGKVLCPVSFEELVLIIIPKKGFLRFLPVGMTWFDLTWFDVAIDANSNNNNNNNNNNKKKTQPDSKPR